MGKLATLVVLIIGIVVNSHAADFRTLNSQYIKVFTNSVNQDLSAVSASTNYLPTPDSIYHTFDFSFVLNGTNNGATLAVDSSIDSNTWINVSNYAMTTTVTNWELTTVGKRAFYRFRETDQATNGTFQILYMGQ